MSLEFHALFSGSPYLPYGVATFFLITGLGRSWFPRGVGVLRTQALFDDSHQPRLTEELCDFPDFQSKDSA